MGGRRCEGRESSMPGGADGGEAELQENYSDTDSKRRYPLLKWRQRMTTGTKQGMIPEKQLGFPYATSELRFDSDREGCAQWHWHSHFEIGIVKTGRLLLGIHNESYTLEAGEGYFVNSSALHYCRAADGERNVCVQVQMFDRSMIADGGMLGKRYVSQMENCIAMDACVLRGEDADAAEVLKNAAAAFEIGTLGEDGYELRIYALMNLAWSSLYRLAKPYFRQTPPARPESTTRARLMLSYIHQHYAEPVSIRQIAEYTGVCERECFRSFNQFFNTTPMDYLNRYRISMAAKKLSETDDPIFQIASDCGFASGSYFSTIFRQIMGKTPREYRKQETR